MRITARRLNRATLERQLLLQRQPLRAEDAVRRVVALQAQEPASPYLALWNRVADFDPTGLDAAFAQGTVVKATLLRMTLHAVHAEDYPAFHAAMVHRLRAARLDDPRFTVSGLAIAEADALMAKVLAFAREQARTKPELEAHLEMPTNGNAQPVWWAMRTFAPLHHAPTGGPWSFGPRAAFVAAPETRSPEEREASIRHLARRYLEGFGPARPRDLAQFTLLTVAVAREAIRALGDELVTLEDEDGAPLVDVAGAAIPDEDVPAPPRLLPMWDSTLLAYADRSRVIPPDYRRIVIRSNGDVLPTLLVDGLVAGIWRPVEEGIEATAFHRLDDEAWAGLASEARALVRFLAGRDPAVYRRYRRWWGRIGGAEVRVLPG
jgi:hypothetical protein